MQKPVKILQASAGSGKTFSLAAHYLTLLFSGENKYREILAVTFTNKATEEMKSRILEVLLGLAKGDPSAKIDAYRHIILNVHSSLDASSLKDKAHVIYRKILHDYSRFSVNTIDGFVQKVIRGFAFELGLDSGYSLEMNLEKVKLELSKRLEKQLDEKDVLLKWVIQLALSRINNNKSWNYRKELLDLSSEIFNDKFKDFEAAISGSEDKDVDQIFKHHIDSSESFVKDFKEGITSIAVLAEKVFEESGYQNKDLQGMSRSNLLKFGKIANGELDKVHAVLKLLNDEEGWFKKGIGNTLFEKLNPLLQQLATIYDAGIAHYTLAGAFLKNGYLLRLMQEIALLLTAYREENDTLLFSDAQKLLNGIAEDAGDNPSFIWEKMGNKYRHFLFDEFQDTSESQWNSFLNLVVNSISTHNGELNDHLIVGDTKQSIYRWRDGDYKLLHHKAGIDLGIQNILEARLEENFRSTEEIINFNNELYPRLAKELQEKINAQITEDESLNIFWTSEKNKYSNIIENIFEGCAQKSHQNTLKDGMIKIHRIDFGSSESTDFEDAENKKEAALIDMHSEIKILLNERGYKQRELGVIVRTNNEAALVVDFLMKAGLDVLSGEALKISNNIAIRLIINALKLLVVTPSNSALYKANCIALYAQIHDEDINSDNYFNLKQTPISEMNDVLPKDFCENYQQWMQLPVPELVEKIIAAFKLDVYIKEDINPFLPYLFAFRDLCGKNSRQGEKGISAFLQWWEEDGSSKNLPSPETANAIQVTTIHKSKGLAFRAVLIPFCSWTLSGGKPNSNFWVPMEHTPYENLKAIPLPYSSSLMGSTVTHRYLEEVLFNYMDALNSLYVATTRAKDYLYIAIPGKKTKTITHIGDVILSAYSAEFEDDNNKLEIGEFSTIGDKIDAVGILEMQKYPTTKRLEEVYKKTENRPQKYVDNISKSARVGNNLHAILADANLVEEIPKAIDKLVLQGQIDKDEVGDYEKRASNVLGNTELASILSQSATQINEKSIIGINGKAYRPDKLVFNKKSVSIIDYKFTAEESEHHVAQIKNYESLLKAMGYDDVKSYLFYEAKSKLKAV